MSISHSSVLTIIRLTYTATLAELTSLEEMLRIMMEDNQIHNDVIAKLWQVYSTCMQYDINAVLTMDRLG